MHVNIDDLYQAVTTMNGAINFAQLCGCIIALLVVDRTITTRYIQYKCIMVFRENQYGNYFINTVTAQCGTQGINKFSIG